MKADKIDRIKRVQQRKRSVSLTIPQITIGAALIDGTRRLFTHKYPDARDFGVNIIRGKFGLYFWIRIVSLKEMNDETDD